MVVLRDEKELLPWAPGQVLSFAGLAVLVAGLCSSSLTATPAFSFTNYGAGCRL